MVWAWSHRHIESTHCCATLNKSLYLSELCEQNGIDVFDLACKGLSLELDTQNILMKVHLYHN